MPRRYERLDPLTSMNIAYGNGALAAMDDINGHEHDSYGHVRLDLSKTAFLNQYEMGHHHQASLMAYQKPHD